MGLSSFLKDAKTALKSDSSESIDTKLSPNLKSNNAPRDSNNVTSPNPPFADHGDQLPAGTGPGTSGKPQAAQSEDKHRDSSRIAVGGGAGLIGAQSTNEHGLNTSPKVMQRDMNHTKIRGDQDGNVADTNTSITHQANSGVFHSRGNGHNGALSDDAMPHGQYDEDLNRLQPVTHNNVRHVETEEVLRKKEHDRHIHHVQHHVQPVIDREEREEIHHDNVVPTTHIHENHVNNDKDVNVLNGLVGRHKDTIAHGDKERTVIDKGEVVKENTHHHVHHVIQPVVEKETLDRHRIHTVIPTHHVTHEAPIVHQSHQHEPMTMEQFTKNGQLGQGIPQADLSNTVLRTGECTREVDGVGEQLARDMNLGNTVKTSNHVPGQGEGEVFPRHNVDDIVEREDTSLRDL